MGNWNVAVCNPDKELGYGIRIPSRQMWHQCNVAFVFKYQQKQNFGQEYLLI